MGDFLFTDLRWTNREAAGFLEGKKPPRTLDDLSPDIPAIAIYYFVRAVEVSPKGPSFTASEFRRLNGCHQQRLVYWDLWAPDKTASTYPLIAIPSDDIGPTAAQRVLYQSLLHKTSDQTVWDNATPSLSWLLRRGRLTSDYVVGNSGPAAYSGSSWNHIWHFCWRFTQASPFEHPPGSLRAPALYRLPLWQIHSRLFIEQLRQPAELRPGDCG